MSRLQNVNVTAQDAASIDSIGRWRVSNPTNIYDGKQILDNLPLFWDEALESGGGISAAHSVDTASTVITSTLNTAGVFTRQTFMRFNYSPGKAQLIYMTGILARSGGGTGVKRRIGQFDDDNGLFFEEDEGIVKAVRRTKVTGTPDDVPVVQSAWNVDKLDGTGPSGRTVTAWDKIEIFALAYEWLGGGSASLGLVFENFFVEVHRFLASDVLDKVFMSTPNLPLRYQMITTGSSPASTMEAICATVISEGGAPDLGTVRYASTSGVHVDANVEDTVYAVIGIRLQSAKVGATIKILKASVAEHAGSKEFEWLLIFNPTVAGTFAYSAETNSAVEIALGALANTVTLSGTATKMTGGYGSSAQKGGNQTNEEIDNARRLGVAIDGTTLDTIVLCVRPVGGNTNLDIEGSLTWRELS